MRHHLHFKAGGLLRALALASALGGATLLAAGPALAFDRGCCCDDGRYDSVGFGAAGTSGGFGGGLGGLGGGLGGFGGGLLGAAPGGPGYGGPAYGGPGYGGPGYGGYGDGYGVGRPVPLRRAY